MPALVFVYNMDLHTFHTYQVRKFVLSKSVSGRPWILSDFSEGSTNKGQSYPMLQPFQGLPPTYEG